VCQLAGAWPTYESSAVAAELSKLPPGPSRDVICHGSTREGADCRSASETALWSSGQVS
jgi:hypothetical protein